MTRDAIAVGRTTMRPLHHQYEARLASASTGADENRDPSRTLWDSACFDSPSLPHRAPKRSKHIYSDRFIPSRLSTRFETGFDIHPELTRQPSDNQIHHLAHEDDDMDGGAANANGTGGAAGGATGGAREASNPKCPTQNSATGTSASSYSMLLQSELLGIDAPATRGRPSDYFHYMDTYYDPYSPPTARAMMSGASAFDFGRAAAGRRGGPAGGALGPSSSSNILRFKAPRHTHHEHVLRTSVPLSTMGGTMSQRVLAAGIGSGAGGLNGGSTRRKIPKTPFKVLDAPALQDDFYLNLVDWSSTNVLAVGLGSAVYLWSACTSKVTQLCDLGPGDCVTSVAWSQRGTHLSVGTNGGEVQVWELASGRRVRTFGGHVARVGTLGWSGAGLLASGSRDRTILLRDLRAPDAFQHKLTGHKQEVCGLKWSFDDHQLATGGNDNKLFVWSLHGASSGRGSSATSRGTPTIPVARFSDHTAAVKAIAWSHHQHGLLASGGGTADRCIRFWNTATNTALQAIDTGSQVCNLMWSRNVNEVVSTHGYSLNQIIVWKYPTMTKLATLTGHTFRVLYLAMSPDGQTIVTGAGDETLRFWNAFPSSRCKPGAGRLGAGLLLPLGHGSEIR